MGNYGIWNDGTHSCRYITGVAGETLAAGDIVTVKQSTESGAEGKYFKCPISGNTWDKPHGVALEAASADAAVRIAVSGIAKVKPEPSTASNLGYILVVSDGTSGTAKEYSGSMPDSIHFAELGHWTQDGAAGALNYAVLHFN